MRAASPADEPPLEIYSSMSGTTISTGQCVFPEPKPLRLLPRYTFLAEYLQESSTGHERQLVALPAAVGLRVLLKYWRDPEEVTVVGICAGWDELGGGEQRSQRSKSIS